MLRLAAFSLFTFLAFSDQISLGLGNSSARYQVSTDTHNIMDISLEASIMKLRNSAGPQLASNQAETDDVLNRSESLTS